MQIILTFLVGWVPSHVWLAAGWFGRFGISCFGAETPPPTNCGGRPSSRSVGGILSCRSSSFTTRSSRLFSRAGWSSCLVGCWLHGSYLLLAAHGCAWAAGHTMVGCILLVARSVLSAGHRIASSRAGWVIPHVQWNGRAGVASSCACVCVPVKPTRGNTT